MDDPFVSCPYDPIHRVPRSRLQRHLIKCEKNFPTYQVCPFNATHRLKPEEYKTHVVICATQDQLSRNNATTSADITAPKAIVFPLEDDEDWD